jgi:hypothetical protein
VECTRELNVKFTLEKLHEKILWIMVESKPKRKGLLPPATGKIKG